MNEAILAGYVILSSFSLIVLMFYVVSCKASLNSIYLNLEDMSDKVKTLHDSQDHFKDAVLRLHYHVLASTSSCLELLEMVHLEKENYEKCGQLQTKQAEILKIMTDIRSRLY